MSNRLGFHCLKKSSYKLFYHQEVLAVFTYHHFIFLNSLVKHVNREETVVWASLANWLAHSCTLMSCIKCTEIQQRVTCEQHVKLTGVYVLLSAFSAHLFFWLTQKPRGFYWFILAAIYAYAMLYRCFFLAAYHVTITNIVTVWPLIG